MQTFPYSLVSIVGSKPSHKKEPSAHTKSKKCGLWLWFFTLDGSESLNIFKSCFYHFHTFRSFALDYFRPLTHWVESRSRHARWGIQRTPTNIWSFSLELPTERAPQMWDLGMMQSSCCFGTNGIAATIARTRSHDGKKKSWKKYCRRTKDCKTVFVAFYTAVLTLRTAKRTLPLASRTAMPFLCH